MKPVFMPGCALSSYNPTLVKKTAAFMRGYYGDIAVILKCCGKPTKYLGQQQLFEQRFEGFMKDVSMCSADTIITACSGCHNTIKEMSRVDVISLWEMFEQTGLPAGSNGKGNGLPFTVFDACATRDNPLIHDSVRNIMHKLGYETMPSPYEREKTRCCGFGGMVGASNPEIAAKSAKRNIESFNTEHIAVYCATCRQAFCMNGGKAWHILDLIWGDVVNKTSTPPANALASPVNAWMNRYKTKRLISKM